MYDPPPSAPTSRLYARMVIRALVALCMLPCSCLIGYVGFSSELIPRAFGLDDLPAALHGMLAVALMAVPVLAGLRIVALLRSPDDEIDLIEMDPDGPPGAR